MNFWPFNRESAEEKRQREIINKLNAMAKTQAQLAADLIALDEQQKKIAKEQSDRFDAQAKAIADLEEAIRNAPVTAEVETALAQLQTTTQALDDTIPDAPPTP